MSMDREGKHVRPAIVSCDVQGQRLGRRLVDVNLTDGRGYTAVDYAMGRAGGNSRGGQRIDVHKDTADLLTSRGGIAGTPVPQGARAGGPPGR